MRVSILILSLLRPRELLVSVYAPLVRCHAPSTNGYIVRLVRDGERVLARIHFAVCAVHADRCAGWQFDGNTLAFATQIGCDSSRIRTCVWEPV